MSLAASLLVGAVGLIHTVLVGISYDQTVAAFRTQCAAHQQDFGYCDFQAVGKNGFLLWVSTWALEGMVDVLLCFVAARIVATLSRRYVLGILTATLVSALGWIWYLGVTVAMVMPLYYLPPDLVGDNGRFVLLNNNLLLTVLIVATLCGAALAGWIGTEHALHRFGDPAFQSSV